MYLGLLFPTEEYKVYGFITNTKIKLIIVTDDADIKDIDLKIFFQKLHATFVNAVCNPFYIPDEKIESLRFDTIVQLLAQTIR